MTYKVLFTLLTFALKFDAQNGQEKTTDFDVATYYSDYDEKVDQFDWGRVFTTPSSTFLDQSYSSSKVVF